MDKIAATGAACWNCGETDAHFEEQGVRVAVSCYECGVRGAWAPTGEEALSSWHDIAETMALAEKVRNPQVYAGVVAHETEAHRDAWMAEKARTGGIEMLAGSMYRSCMYRHSCAAPAPDDDPKVCCAWEICRALRAQEPVTQKTGMIGGGMYTIIDPGEKRVKAEPAPCGACGGTGGFSQGGMRIDCPICGGDGKSAKAEPAGEAEAEEARIYGDMVEIDRAQRQQEADHKIAEAARGCMETCVAAAPEVVRCPRCACRKVCIAIREAQNSPQKPLDTGKGEG